MTAIPQFRAGYPGSKGGAGVVQTIINNIPPCDTFIEAFAGTGFVTRSLRAARSRVLIDADEVVCAALRRHFHAPKIPPPTAGLRIVRADALRWFDRHHARFDRRTVIYFDPPYLVNRHGGQRRDYYAHEFKSEGQHLQLLALALTLGCQGVRCLISGYRCPLYEHHLAAWRRVDYTTATRGGAVTESLWCNFAPPAALHDYRYVGDGFRERERIKRKQARWRARLAGMEPLERAAIIKVALDYNTDPLAGNDEAAP